jgi:hypothetical protein
VIELIALDWSIRKEHAAPLCKFVDEHRQAGKSFRLVVAKYTTPELTFSEVVKWWEDYIGPADMLQSLEIIQ